MDTSSSSSSSSALGETSSSYDEFRDDLIYDSMDNYTDTTRPSDYEEDETDDVDHDGLTLSDLGNSLQSDTSSAQSDRRRNSSRNES